MEQTINTGKTDDYEISLESIFKLIQQNIIVVVGLTLLITISSVIYALSIDKYYKAHVLMVSSLESSSQSSLLGGLLGGSADRISFSTGEVTSEEALATLTSRKFVEGFIDDNDALKIIFFESWDDTKDEWKIELDEAPSISDGYEFIVNNLDISLDNSLITVEFLFGNKEEVASILNSLIYGVNSYIRKESISDSQSNISFLQKEIEKTQLSASREMLYRIVEQQTQSIMLANTREDYAFKIIDPAIEPKNPAGPNRKLIVIIGLLLGSLISVIAVIFINFFKISRVT